MPKDFLLVGQRWDLDVTEPLDFGPGWEEALGSARSNRVSCIHRLAVIISSSPAKPTAGCLTSRLDALAGITG